MTELTNDYKTLINVDFPDIVYKRNNKGDYTITGMILTNEEFEKRRKKTNKLP